ncbi:hypothetical protein AHiyo8_35420 [Arthrobacter sp. Hiyo8]|nr:hypothetical protein AHiyo8_35420 [Arthrobacter sp. Hiyo8]
MLSKPQLINGGIGVAVVGIAAGAFFVLNGVPQTAADTTARTVAVSSADLAAVSTASGNVSPQAPPSSMRRTAPGLSPLSLR